jgi:hypothetical protein
MKKKMYIQPTVEATQLLPSTIVLAGSPGTLQNSGKGTGELGTGDIIGG